MENDIGPAFVKINYISKYAPHSMSVPSVPVTAVGGETEAPVFTLRGAELPVSVDTAIRDFVNVIKAHHRTTTNFIDYTVYSKPGVGDIPVPVWSASLGITGTDAAAGDDIATQRTLSFRADDFTLFRLVLLDVNTAGYYGKQTSSADSPLHETVLYTTSLATWIASRGGGRPKTFLSMTTTKNEKLRRSYRLT